MNYALNSLWCISIKALKCSSSRPILLVFNKIKSSTRFYLMLSPGPGLRRPTSWDYSGQLVHPSWKLASMSCASGCLSKFSLIRWNKIKLLFIFFCSRFSKSVRRSGTSSEALKVGSRATATPRRSWSGSSIRSGKRSVRPTRPCSSPGSRASNSPNISWTPSWLTTTTTSRWRSCETR